MDKPAIKLLVTDLDNTLYDWVTFFAYALYEMVTEAAEILEVSEPTLLDELQRVHQRYGNSEYPFALIETQSVLDKFPGWSPHEVTQALHKAFHRFNRARHQKLTLYPGVSSTLKELHDKGILIVGHTEATTINALYRLKKLCIAPYFNRLYAQASEGEHRLDLIWEMAQDSEAPDIAHIKREERKPNPRIVTRVCSEMGIAPAQTLYVGDSIVSDIGMAKEAGAWTAWAEYGTHYDPSSWDKLVRITHWTAEDVRRVKQAREKYGRSLPDVILHTAFSDILKHFNFLDTPK
jgi:HAD superfamily hydrolase (TIGR01662 family)